jgi:hypothetical protein
MRRGPWIDTSLQWNDDFPSHPVDCNAGSDTNLAILAYDIKTAQHAHSEGQAVQQPLFQLAVVLLHAELRHVQSLAIEVVVTPRGSQRAQMLK